MGGGQALGRLEGQAQGPFLREGTILPDHAAQGTALDELHRHEDPVAQESVIEDGGHVRVADPPCGADLAADPRQGQLVGLHPGPVDLERQDVVDEAIARLVDATAPPGAQTVEELVAPEVLQGAGDARVVEPELDVAQGVAHESVERGRLPVADPAHPGQSVPRTVEAGVHDLGSDADGRGPPRVAHVDKKALSRLDGLLRGQERAPPAQIPDPGRGRGPVGRPETRGRIEAHAEAPAYAGGCGEGNGHLGHG